MITVTMLYTVESILSGHVTVQLFHPQHNAVSTRRGLLMDVLVNNEAY